MNELPYSNISSYRFVDLSDDWIRSHRSEIRDECVRHELFGTILLSPEGVNVTVSGRTESVREFWNYFTGLPRLEGMTFKVSFSDRPTFSRMLVKIKKEIIAFGRDDVRPSTHASKRVTAHQLKEWLDKGRDVWLLDTRNAYEVELGTFSGSCQLDIDSFRAFPEAASRLDDELRSRTVVTFCTGGIRCEKAAPFLEKIGFTDVYQLDGGILQYFEDCGGEHWQGECFVFDKRVALNARLQETDTEYCFRCQHVLSLEDRASPEYELGVRCPYCVDSDGRGRRTD